MVDTELGLKPTYEERGWNQHPVAELTPQLQQMADHLEGWFRQKRWLLETIYYQKSSPSWTDLAFVFNPSRIAKINRLVRHLNPNSVVGLKTLLKLPESEIREDGMLAWYSAYKIPTYGMIHPKSLGLVIGYHGVALREQFIEKIDPEKVVFLSKLPNPHVVSWVDFHPLYMVRTQKSYYSGGIEKKWGLEHRTKFVFEAHIVNVNGTIRGEIARRQKKSVVNQRQKLDLELLQGVLDHFRESPDFLL